MKATVEKLKSLIEAIDLMSEEEEWTPTAKQWKRIKQMIEELEEAPAPAVAQVAYRNESRPESTMTRVETPRPTPRGPNPAETGNIAFPQIPVGDAPTMPSAGAVANPGAADGQSPDAAPTSPGI